VTSVEEQQQQQQEENSSSSTRPTSTTTSSNTTTSRRCNSCRRGVRQRRHPWSPCAASARTPHTPPPAPGGRRRQRAPVPCGEKVEGQGDSGGRSRGCTQGTRERPAGGQRLLPKVLFGQTSLSRGRAKQAFWRCTPGPAPPAPGCTGPASGGSPWGPACRPRGTSLVHPSALQHQAVRGQRPTAPH